MKRQFFWLCWLPFRLAFGLLCLSFIRRAFRIPVAFSFAQGAEDLLITYLARYYFGIEGSGKYVDVGCNLPVKFSNTFSLYLNGWRGLNIDANRELLEKFRKVRRGETCIHAAVSDSVRKVTFYKSNYSALSTIDEARFNDLRNSIEFNVSGEEILTSRTLTSILDENWQYGKEIDLLSIDVEGHDYHVLKGLDLQKYRPKIIVIEIHAIDSVVDTEIYKYLIANHYKLKFFAVLSAYFIDNQRHCV